MSILIVSVTILVITSLAFAFNELVIQRSGLKKNVHICPLCIGVSGTWFLILCGIVLGILSEPSWRLIAAMLMGSSAAGIAYQAENRFSAMKAHPVIAKLVIMLLGFFLVYAMITNLSRLSLFITVLILVTVASILFVRYGRKTDSGGGDEPREIQEIEKKLKGCC